MTRVSERGAHVPMQGQVVTLQVMRLLQEVVQVQALLVWVLFLMKVVMMLEEVLLAALSSLSLSSPPPQPQPHVLAGHV